MSTFIRLINFYYWVWHSGLLTMQSQMGVQLQHSTENEFIILLTGPFQGMADWISSMGQTYAQVGRLALYSRVYLYYSFPAVVNTYQTLYLQLSDIQQLLYRHPHGISSKHRGCANAMKRSLFTLQNKRSDLIRVYSDTPCLQTFSWKNWSVTAQWGFHHSYAPLVPS